MQTWLTPVQAAAYVGCVPETIRVALRSGTLKGVQSGGAAHGRWRTTHEWVDNWIMDEEKVAA